MLPNARTVAAKQHRPRKGSVTGEELTGVDRAFRIKIYDFNLLSCSSRPPPLILSPLNGPPGALSSTARGAALVDELHDADGDGAEQEDVDEAFLAQHEFSHEPRGEERRGEQTDVQVKPNPFA